MESSTHGVVGGAGIGTGGTWYTTDGKGFQQSVHEVGIITTQAIYSLQQTGHYAYVGVGTGLEHAGGIGTSTDGAYVPPIFYALASIVCLLLVASCYSCCCILFAVLFARRENIQKAQHLVIAADSGRGFSTVRRVPEHESVVLGGRELARGRPQQCCP